eukprot:10555899-Prorocentrum_lima.AAC.1
MTSSLVGSEMCIRDRTWSLLQIAWWLRCRVCEQPFHAGSGASLRHWPVSYTHLTLPTICSV